ncbi:MAG: hypothetical protein WC783_02850 [Candidatus Paceibacterota bacterium]|jgi:hypothetical protein
MGIRWNGDIFEFFKELQPLNFTIYLSYNIKFNEIVLEGCSETLREGDWLVIDDSKNYYVLTDKELKERFEVEGST